MVLNGLFIGIGKFNIFVIISVVFIVLRILMLLILIKLFGVNGIWISIVLLSILKGSFVYLLYWVKVKRKYKEVK